MLKGFLELKVPLTYIYRNTTNEEYRNIFPQKEMFVLSQILKTFEIFSKPSIKLQGQIYTTLPSGLLYIYSIYNNLDNLIEEYERKLNRDPDLVSFFLKKNKKNI
jgi:hypothetical protein